MYLTYDEYLDYGGTLKDTEFDAELLYAESIINQMTFNRLKGDPVIPEEVKRLIVYIMNLIGKKSESLKQSVASQSNDGVSISYTKMSPTELYKACEQEIAIAVRRFLYGVKNSKGQELLYRGVY